MELGVGERDVAEHDADQNVAAAMGDEIEAGVHRRGRSGAVEHAVEEIAAGQRAAAFAGALARFDRLLDADCSAREGEAIGARVEHRDVAAARAGEDRGGEPDRAGPDDGDLLAGLDRAASRGMRADGEKLGHRRFVEADAFGVDEIVLRHGEPFGEAAVAVDADDVHPLAAVGLAAAAGDAAATGDIGNDRHLLADAEAARPGDRGDFAAKFMADHARIFEIGLRALENVQVGAADARPPDAHQRSAGPGDRRRPFDEREFARACTEKGSHDRIRSHCPWAMLAC